MDEDKVQSLRTQIILVASMICVAVVVLLIDWKIKDDILRQAKALQDTIDLENAIDMGGQDVPDGFVARYDGDADNGPGLFRSGDLLPFPSVEVAPDPGQSDEQNPSET